MSDDIPLARATRAVAHSTVGPWELLYYGSVLGATVLTLVSEPAASTAWRVGVIAVALTLAAWYAVVGHRAIRTGAGGAVACTGLLVLFAAALAFTQTASYLLLGLPALPHLMLSNRRAHAVVVAFCATPTTVYLVATGDVRRGLTMLAPIGIAAALFSALIATVIARIERRSEERAELIRELEASRGEIARLSREAGIADERQRLAGEIHDTVAQGLSSVVMLVQAADATMDADPRTARAHLALAARTARENLDETRAIVAALAPPPLTGATLPEALRRLGERFGADSGLAVEVEIAGQPRPLATAVEVVLLRAAQESLTNAGKHARAGRARLVLSFDPGGVALEVRDDGQGFDPAAPTAGFGLPTMRGRVEQVGGVLTVHSVPGTGTRVRAEVYA